MEDVGEIQGRYHLDDRGELRRGGELLVPLVKDRAHLVGGRPRARARVRGRVRIRVRVRVRVRVSVSVSVRFRFRFRVWVRATLT